MKKKLKIKFLAFKLKNRMTIQQKNNIGTGVTVANFVMILTFVTLQSKWQERVDNKIQVLEKTIELFVPRIELDSRLENLQYTLDKIEKKIDKIN